MKDYELTLLSIEEILGNDQILDNANKTKQIEVFKKYGTKAAVTDLCILCGGKFDGRLKYSISGEELAPLKGRPGMYWTKSHCYEDIFLKYTFGKSVKIITEPGTIGIAEFKYAPSCCVRPILQLSRELFAQITSKRTKGYNDTEEVEFGEYPQYAVSNDLQKILTLEHEKGMNKTGRTYTFEIDADNLSKYIMTTKREEYEFQGKKYVYINASKNINTRYPLSNNIKYKEGDCVWVEVSPVKWLIDDENKQLISKYSLVSGIRFMDRQAEYNGDFSKTEMKEYLDDYMVKDLFQSVDFEYLREMGKSIVKSENIKKSNPYNLSFNKVSEEDIIKGAIESGVPVFLHGPSSEGKSARVKQIDPTCEIIYLRNATPDSLNGKSVYNSETGEMIDVPPTWLKKLQAKCENEPDKLHILFFDEITNALPSIQGIAFNIVLDREVNGIWKLPENARIVAAGNDMKDSLAANQLAEPLFNRFAHVYIKTTTESWLKWASENNIHPAIYSYIAYKNGETLRSKYDGEKPNADPRKWEMASKMLYTSGNPKMLRALVGEDITKEFVEFCKQEVITLEDVINGNYTEKEIESLNIAERYATIMGLSQVDETNLEIVRNFVTNLGAEFKAVFDAIWTHGDESRLEIIAESKLIEKSLGGKKL